MRTHGVPPRFALLGFIQAVLLTALLVLVAAPVATAAPVSLADNEVAVSTHLGGSTSDHRDTRLTADRVAIANPQAHQHFAELPAGLPVAEPVYPRPSLEVTTDQAVFAAADGAGPPQAPTRGPPATPGT
ncbi:hypothetical protein N8J89_14990 [Crossiella sp. CA-258035]|uniref:hypothetical protein n=1 Tax=Crossiella sp. CA-258035 TaxID=2981138 RepID=UPI0024BC65F3|nr:hypothetical protein [Crossiella sp. CA-258035]WHT22317.1 hypothetical protein N8J89_14990 [Crossiella sp. CA-258035]